MTITNSTFGISFSDIAQFVSSVATRDSTIANVAVTLLLGAGVVYAAASLRDKCTRGLAGGSVDVERNLLAGLNRHVANEGTHYPEAHIAATRAITSENVRIRVAGLHLLTRLVQRQYAPAYPTAQEAGNQAVARGEESERVPVLDLFDVLVRQTPEDVRLYDAARSAALYAAGDPDVATQNMVYRLLATLVRRGHVHPAMIGLAILDRQSPLLETRLRALAFFNTLVREGHLHPAALAAATLEGEEPPSDPREYEATVLILEAFVERGEAFGAAVERAMAAWPRNNNGVRFSGLAYAQGSLRLFETLVIHDHQEAFAVARAAAEIWAGAELGGLGFILGEDVEGAAQRVLDALAIHDANPPQVEAAQVEAEPVFEE